MTFKKYYLDEFGNRYSFRKFLFPEQIVFLIRI